MALNRKDRRNMAVNCFILNTFCFLASGDFIDRVSILCNHTLDSQSPIKTLQEAPIDASSDNLTFVPMLIDVAFDNVSETRRANLFMNGMGRYCFYDQPLDDQVMPPEGATTSYVMFTNPFIRNVTVIEPFNYDTKAVRVQIDTTWMNISGNYTAFLQGIIENTLLNISFLTYVKPYATINEPCNCNTPHRSVQECRYEIPMEYCLTHARYYYGVYPTLESGKCTIPFTKQIEKYKNMWIPPGYPSSEYNTRCINPTKISIDDYITVQGSAKFGSLFPRYGYPYASPYRVLPWNGHQQLFFHEGATGQVKQITVGKGTDYDVNITVDITLSTFEFYQYFLDMFRDKDVVFGYGGSVTFLQYKLTNLTVYYYVPAVPVVVVRGIPYYTWVFLIIMTVPGASFLFAMVMIISVRSFKGFHTEIWTNWMLERRMQERLATLKAEQAKMFDEP